MEVQSECVEPPVAPHCEPQPTGKINKAAFKLFGKRRTGSGMASFFSFRNKGATNSGNNGISDSGNGSVAPVDLIRSKTHDGLTGSNSDADGNAGERLTAQEAGPVRSLSKSFSFFSLLRRGSFRSSENGGAGFAGRGRSLKGFFSSMRWKRKDKTNEGDGEVLEVRKEKDGDITQDEKVKDITLTLEPHPHHHLEDCRDHETEPNEEEVETPATSNTITPSHCVAMPGPSCVPDSPFPYTPTDSPIHPSVSKAKASVSSLTPSLATPPPDRCSTGDPPSEPSVDRLCSLLFTDVTSLKSFDSLTGCGDIIADAEEECPTGNGGNGGSGTSSSSSGGSSGSAGGSAGRVAATVLVSPSKPRLPSQMAQAMFSISPSSVSVPLHARARVTPALQQPPAGSGVVAYMGGGEEMASPEGVDDADMQGLWHMLPATGENSPALPRSLQPPSSTPTATYPPCSTANPTSSHLSLRSADRKVPQVKALGLSKIPVVGGAGGRAAKLPLPHLYGHHATSPNEKEPLSDEGYWETPSATPTATPDEIGLQRNQKVPLSRDSCSGDHLYDLYNDPEVEGDDEEQEGDEDFTSTPSPSTECKQSSHSQTTPPPSSSSTSFRSMKGSTSLPRESKIPVSTRQATPPHSVSQSSLSSVQESEAHRPKNQAPAPARTRIPVSKMPVRRSGNKPGSSSRGTGSKK
ncbi:APC membrane recruitment protein 2 [Thalassophryne amazonica]|uniref:APC membrane recruitment protein 2 n=1 Tax=Thalassophryne amazonica TaxID=390379 RepID=UPI001471421E|nr:APC membrane recruitment protein 2 [Thalassophryne amazonica]XP_034020368.1 APC membrane recruitment protein 2 [Thalassophryne amazonica]